MKGIIDKIWENKTKAGKKYWVLSIGGDNYSVWDKKYLEEIQEGSTVEYEWTPSGDYRKVTGIKKIETEADINLEINVEGKPNPRNQQIVRMSCIKSASLLVSNFDVHPIERGEITLGLARKFENYVTERGGNEEGKGKQKQEQEE